MNALPPTHAPQNPPRSYEMKWPIRPCLAKKQRNRLRCVT